MILVINFDAVREQVESRYITVRKHPTADLFIYNYTPRAMYERRWTPETTACRGLIADGQDRIVARPFKKFFNYGELDGKVPAESFEVYEKVDGCLAILYWIGDEPFLATRGSFESEQAVRANEVFKAKGYHGFDFDRRFTYLFEFVSPKFRIVVDYGETEDLFLLAVIETNAGGEVGFDAMPWIPFPHARRFSFENIKAVLAMQNKEDEGFVVRFESGFRCKIKMDEYVRLHRILTHISARRIYEYMAIADMRDKYGAKQMGRTLFMNPSEVEQIAAAKDPFEEILDKVPDEFYKWVRNTKTKLEGDYAVIEDTAIELFRRRPDGDRRAQAEYFGRAGVVPSILFNMLDGKDYRADIWRQIRPAHEKPFMEDDG